MAGLRATTPQLLLLLLLLAVMAGVSSEDLLQRAARASTSLPLDPRCRADVLLYLSALGNFSLWAVRMFDSTTKFPDSIMSGAAYHLGNFDTCLDVDDGNHIKGRYCLARVQFEPVTSATQIGTAWDMLKAHSNRLKIRRDVFHSAVCLPSSCDHHDVASLLRELLASTPLLSQHVAVQVAVSRDMCYTKEEVAAGAATPPLAWAAVIVLLSIIVLSTIHDNMHHDHDVHRASWKRTFSLSHQWRKLTTRAEDDRELYIPCLDGLRVVALTIVVIGHRGEATMAGPVINGEVIEKFYKNFAEALIMNGHLVVDTFFTMSGFLLCWTYLNVSEDKRRPPPNIFVMCINRYVRLSPALMAVVAFEAFFLFNFSTGPLWKLKIGNEMKNCQTNWWTNVLFINNYVHPRSPCVDTAWYAACDFQIFVAACILMECVKRFKKYGFIILLTSVISSIGVTATLTYIKDLDPTMIPDQTVLGHSYNDTYLMTYITAYCRSGAYFVGMIFAYWLFIMKQKKLKIDKMVVCLGWILSPLIATLVVGAGFLFYLPFQINKLLLAAYSGLHRPLFGMCIAFVITACATENGGVVAKVLEWKSFRPVSQLTYCIYLVHYMVQMVRSGNLRTPKIIGDFDMACDAISDIVLSLCLAFILFVAVEQPGIILWNKILFKITSGSEQSNGSVVPCAKNDKKDIKANYLIVMLKYFSTVLPRTAICDKRKKFK